MALTREERQRRLDRLLALRATGLSPAAIAEQEARELGRKARPAAAVKADIDAALNARREDVVEEAKDALVVLELERLDALQRAAEATLRSANAGRCAHCGRSPDPELALRAIGHLTRLSSRRAVLLGLDNRRREAAQEEDPLELTKRRVGMKAQLRAVQ